MSDGEQSPAINEVVDMNLNTDNENRYLVLFDEDYTDFLVDRDDSLAILVDCKQAAEVMKLASKALGELAPEDAPNDEPIDVMIKRLKRVRDNE